MLNASVEGSLRECVGCVGAGEVGSVSTAGSSDEADFHAVDKENNWSLELRLSNPEVWGKPQAHG